MTPEVVDLCRGIPTIAVNDAHRMIPHADILYAADDRWWLHHRGCPDFAGEKWTTHSVPGNDKLKLAERYGLNLIRGTEAEGFSLDPDRIHYGSNSGFQAINFGLHGLAFDGLVLLIGFDMRVVDGRRHFFGDHPIGMRRMTDYTKWFPEFAMGAKSLPPSARVINCTPDSALPHFEMMDLNAALTLPAMAEVA